MTTVHLRSLRLTVMAGALAMTLSCATAPKRAESPPPRMKDSAPEKVAAQRAGAAHELQLEQDDERWGIEAARERKRQKEEATPPRKPGDGKKGVEVTPP